LAHVTGSPAEMFYDAGCGPCTFFARVSQVSGHHRISIYPLAGVEADRVLTGMPEQRRYDSFHLSLNGSVLSATEALPALVGLVAGEAAERTYRAVSPVRRLGERVYWSFWRARRTKGCAAGTPQSS
jgi:predicted DCC family thiol-disulfide oxidoreductase YuxK